MKRRMKRGVWKDAYENGVWQKTYKKELYIYIYIYISATVPSGIQCVFDPMQNSQSSDEEGSRRFSSFKGQACFRWFYSFYPHYLFQLCFCFFSYSIFSHICPKALPKRASKKHQKSSKSIKYQSLNLAWKSCLQKGPPKCENRTPFNVLRSSRGSQALRKASQIGSQMDPKTAKCSKMTHPKKRLKTYHQQIVKSNKIVSKLESQKSTVRVPKITKIRKTSRDPKGIQKASKRRPKSIQKASKCHGKGSPRNLQPNTISQTRQDTLDKLMQECLPCILHVTCARRFLF